MSELSVLDRNFIEQGIIDDYVSCIWRPAYYDIGDFELYINANSNMVELLKENRYIVRSQDISVVNGQAIYKKVMIIKNITTTTDIEDGDYILCTGYELKYLLHQRIVWSQTTLTGTAQNAIRTLVTQNAINPSDSKRKIPNLALDTASALSDSINMQVTGDPLDEVIRDICIAFNYGWELYIKNNQILVRVYKGQNKSKDNIPNVIFSDDYENLDSTTYELNTELYANTALVGGEGEGSARKFVTINTNNTGLDRFETFVDARDLSSNNGEISTGAYTQLLNQRGKERLAEFSVVEGFSGEVVSDVGFKYGRDFDLGDLVTVITKYGINKDVMVLSAIESDDSSGTKLIPQFNI